MPFFYRRVTSPVPPLSSSSSSVSSISSPNGPRKKQSGRSPGGIGVVSPAVIPDMRFEQSYLSSIRGFIHELEPAQARKEKRQAAITNQREKEPHRRELNVEEEEEEGGEKLRREEEEEEEEGGEGEDDPPRWIEARNPKGEPELWIGRLRIDWVPLLYVTFRDQLLSPLVQGAVWGVVGLCLSQGKGILKSYLLATGPSRGAGGKRGG